MVCLKEWLAAAPWTLEESTYRTPAACASESSCSEDSQSEGQGAASK